MVSLKLVALIVTYAALITGIILLLASDQRSAGLGLIGASATILVIGGAIALYQGRKPTVVLNPLRPDSGIEII